MKEALENRVHTHTGPHRLRVPVVCSALVNYSGVEGSEAAVWAAAEAAGDPAASSKDAAPLLSPLLSSFIFIMESKCSFSVSIKC